MDYILKKNKRSKVMRIIVHPDGRVVVTVPYRMPTLLAKGFVLSKESWIQERLAVFQKKEMERISEGIPKRQTQGEQKKEYEKIKESVRKVIEVRVAKLNRLYGFTYGAIAIRNQSTRWGSCSKKGNLNFNYKVGLLPQSMMDYVIVHELCHLAEFNHSKRFWDLVAEAVPDYQEIRRELKKRDLRFD